MFGKDKRTGVHNRNAWAQKAWDLLDAAQEHVIGSPERTALLMEAQFYQNATLIAEGVANRYTGLAAALK